jgi:hypothetical protein
MRSGIFMVAAAIIAIAGAPGAQAQGAAAAPNVPTACASLWAPYGAAKGSPLKVGTYHMDGFQFPDQKLTVTISSISNGIVHGHERYYGYNPANGRSWDKRDEFRGHMVGPYTATWKNAAGSTLIAKSLASEIVGVQDSVVYNACTFFVLRRVGAE